MSAIEVRGLTKRFGAQAAVDDLSFTVAAGSVTGFLGPNGAGKSTTLRMLLGLVEPDAGTATVLGRRYDELPDAGRQVGAMLDAGQFHPGRSGRNALRVTALALGVGRQRVEEVLAQVGLADAAGARVGTYSLGMRQRLGLALALLPDPAVLVLDEPANGLDPQGIAALRDQLRGFAAQGRAVLVSSHLLAEVAQTVDRVVLIAAGRCVADTTLSELTAQAGAGVVRVRSPQAATLHRLLTERGLAPRPVGAGMLVVAGVSAAEVGDLMAEHRLVTHLLSQDQASLEEVYLRLTGTLAGPAQAMAL